MGYDQRSRSSVWAVIFVVVPVVLMVTGLLFMLAAAGWLYLRLGQEPQVATVARDQDAMHANDVADRVAEEAGQAAEARKTDAELEAETDSQTTLDPDVLIEMNQVGELQLNGEAIQLETLPDDLRRIAAGAQGSTIIVVHCDEDSRFRDLAALISTCQESGFTRFRFRILPGANADQPEQAESVTVIK